MKKRIVDIVLVIVIIILVSYIVWDKCVYVKNVSNKNVESGDNVSESGEMKHDPKGLMDFSYENDAIETIEKNNYIIKIYDFDFMNEYYWTYDIPEVLLSKENNKPLIECYTSGFYESYCNDNILSLIFFGANEIFPEYKTVNIDLDKLKILNNDELIKLSGRDLNDIKEITNNALNKLILYYYNQRYNYPDQIDSYDGYVENNLSDDRFYESVQYFFDYRGDLCYVAIGPDGAIAGPCATSYKYNIETDEYDIGDGWQDLPTD